MTKKGKGRPLSQSAMKLHLGERKEAGPNRNGSEGVLPDAWGY